jgi:uncharacterized membrane protein YjjP (DUF1212 family)
MIRRASEGNLEVEVSKNQMEYIFKVSKEYLKSSFVSFAFIFASIFYLLYGFEPKEISIVLFLFGFIRLFYK